MNVFIRQLTGIRFVAAAWVVLYHFQVPLATLGLLSIPVFNDTVRVGRLGVDLFFALSGFILTHTYLNKLGPKLAGRKSVDFWWLRLARIYPVHLVMLIIAGVAVVAQAKVGHTPLSRSWLNPLDFGKNLLLIQEWGPNPQRGWNFVAWSLSMEWLAYLIFPLLVLALWIFHKKVSTKVLCLAWVVVLVPLMAYAVTRSDSFYTNNWGSTLRILTEFTAGAITYLIVRRLIPKDSVDASARAQRLATTLSIALPVLVIAGATVLGHLAVAQPPLAVNAGPDAEPLPPYFHLLLVPLLIAWIGALAVSRRGMSTVLATRIAVFGGFISYSMYMTHLVWFGLWKAGMKAAHITHGALYAIGFVFLLVGTLFFAWAMWKVVEEPAREWMRRLSGARPIPTEEAGEAEGGPSPEPVIVPGS